MTLVAAYQDARRDERLAQLRRAVALRAMVETGMSQREIAQALGVSQPAVSQQLKAADLTTVDPKTLLDAAAPVLRQLSDELGYSDLAVFGSVARGDARQDSDIDLLVQPPAHTSISSIVAFRDLIERTLDRPVDVVSYGGLKPGIDDDIRREAVLL